MPYAYKDSGGSILALSSKERTLAQAQTVNPDIASVDPNPSQAELAAYHGATNLFLAKVNKAAAVDRRTEELIREGFVSTIAAPKRFALDPRAMSRYTSFYVARNETWFTYPLVINTHGNDNLQILPNAGAVASLFEEAVTALRVYIDSGSDLKVAIRAASNRAELDAVEDNR